jgi:hypothetical protein
VTGTGFPPRTVAQLSYAGGRSTATARVGATGSFAGHLQAEALVPGDRTVTATDGSNSASAHFTQQL